MMRIISLFTLIAIGFAKIEDCDTTSIFRPTILTLTPDPPIAGQLVQLGLVFDNKGSVITSGTATTALTLNGLPFTPDIKPLCEATECPIIYGINNRSTEMTWPSVNGKVTSQITWSGSNSETLLCILINVKILLNHSINSIQVYKALRG